VIHSGLPVEGDHYKDSEPVADAMAGQTSQLLLENLYLKLRLRDQSAQSQGLRVSTKLPLVPQLWTFDDFVAQKLLAGHPRFRRIRKAAYHVLKPIWRMWLAGRTLLRTDEK